MIDKSQLRGMSKEIAELYGKPHIGARYVGSDRSKAMRYERIYDACFLCGRLATNCHHVVPRGKGQVFTLSTPKGTWRLRSPLFALCGSGTTGCHNGFHGGALYRARWVWDDPTSEEAWWSGELLSELTPHSPGLYLHGRWEIDDGRSGLTIVYREGA